MEMTDITTICFIISYALLFISAILSYMNMRRLRKYMEYYELCADTYLRTILSHEEYLDELESFDEPEGVHMDTSMFDVSGNKVKRT